MEEMDKYIEYTDAACGIEEDIENDYFVREEDYPYRVEDIRIEQRMLSLYQVCKWIEQQSLILNPEFQRNFVWGIEKQSLLIESLMLRIPIPAFYFDENEEGQKIVIDGMQRLTTIYRFVNNEFALKGLQYLTQYNKKCFRDLDRKFQLRIEDTQLAVNILDPRCPETVKFDVFRRINTGGISLNPQEVRNIMANDNTRELIFEMANSPEFLEATQGKISDKRMKAQELCLRYITYLDMYDFEHNQFVEFGNMTQLLDRKILELNRLYRSELVSVYTNFTLSMRKCIALFGKRAFRKKNVTLINRALFVSMSVALSNCRCSEEALVEKRDEAISRLDEMLEKNDDYFYAITSSTSSRTNMLIQFYYAKKLLEDIDV